MQRKQRSCRWSFLPVRMEDRKLLPRNRTRKKAQKRRETRPFRALDGFNEIRLTLLEGMAGTTGLEPAASAVTGQRSNQLNYVPAEGKQRHELCAAHEWWAVQGSNLRPPACKAGALTN